MRIAHVVHHPPDLLVGEDRVIQAGHIVVRASRIGVIRVGDDRRAVTGVDVVAAVSVRIVKRRAEIGRPGRQVQRGPFAALECFNIRTVDLPEAVEGDAIRRRASIQTERSGPELPVAVVGAGEVKYVTDHAADPDAGRENGLLAASEGNLINRVTALPEKAAGVVESSPNVVHVEVYKTRAEVTIADVRAALRVGNRYRSMGRDVLSLSVGCRGRHKADQQSRGEERG